MSAPTQSTDDETNDAAESALPVKRLPCHVQGPTLAHLMFPLREISIGDPVHNEAQENGEDAVSQKHDTHLPRGGPGAEATAAPRRGRRLSHESHVHRDIAMVIRVVMVIVVAVVVLRGFRAVQQVCVADTVRRVTSPSVNL